MNSKQLEIALLKPEGRRLKAELDINWFCIYYLGEHFKNNIHPLHREWLSLAQKYKRIAIAAPRQHSKTTTFSLAYALWCLLFHKKKFIVLISDTSSQAEEILGAIVQELETNERIIRDFGRIAGYIPDKNEEKTKWTAKDIITTTGVKVIGRGWKGKLRGVKFGADRPDLIIMDDVENDENVQSEDQRVKVKNMFNKSIMNLGIIDFQIIVVGTILHFDSLLMNLINNPPTSFWFIKMYRAIENNKPILPEIWTMEKLDEKRADIGSIAFEQEFMNNPLDPSSQILKIGAWYDSVDLNFLDRFAYLDLSARKGEENDWNAIVTLGKHRQTGKLYTIDPRRMKGGINEVIKFVVDYYLLYNHQVIGIETNGFQEWFYQILQEYCLARKLYIPMMPIEQIKDKVTRAKSMSIYTENGTVMFNRSYQDFNAEIEQFPKASHDDWVDSLTEGIRLAINTSNTNGVRGGRGTSYPE